ncbi:FadR/GntR family transcriptional regulator [Silvibacterium dinghuense]|uniref:FadR family transcriptional regulator n=1 Tax=Silvibacterium dinghuense TaxID=1560006 RepID=A0A4Q1SAA1_9BACT|nr:FadR/GntR family transcriptional regulator [Silvibacterium dinghuense]RXS93859.1 FadR family transcriptional regulator [Silvibacterium dinghuense]GGH08283.1 GntR family transcriptional regulator [Silvibacterium dinghuense]
MTQPMQHSAENDRTRQVVNHIRALIENGTLKPGDKIPPERDFARQLHISRASLRAGIGYLAALGVMKIKHGVGTFVADGPPEFGQGQLSLIGALHGFQNWHLFEARNLLESGLAALAAERGKEEHHAALAEEVAEMFASVEKPSEYLIHDVLFHRIIAQAAGNPILAAIMETVSSSMYDARRNTVEHSIDLRESAEMHREIYRAIRGRKPEEARRLMEKHLESAKTNQGLERIQAKPRATAKTANSKPRTESADAALESIPAPS